MIRVRLSGTEALTIRAPCVDDYSRMADLAGQLGYPSLEQQLRSRVERMNDDDHGVFVAELTTGQIAGWIGLHIFRSVELNHCAFITGLIVDKGLRSRGIGRVLLEVAEAWAGLRRCEQICVSSNVTRTRAHSFYLENGYEGVKTQITFVKNLAHVKEPQKRAFE
jgi:GNAT superfamily N-acetyltransferase